VRSWESKKPLSKPPRPVDGLDWWRGVVECGCRSCHWEMEAGQCRCRFDLTRHTLRSGCDSVTRGDVDGNGQGKVPGASVVTIR
jgi:hypothetical protein